VLRFDPDELSILDWEEIEAVAQEPGGPDGQLWPEDTPLLRKLAAWASYAIWLCERDYIADDDS
jgi:hypothetical protein